MTMVRALIIAGIVLASTAALAQEGAPAPAAPQPAALPVAQPQPAPPPAATDKPADLLPDKAQEKPVEKPVLEAKEEPFPWETIGEASFFVGVAGTLGGGVFVLLTRKADNDYQDAKDQNSLYQDLAVGCFIAGGILLLGGGTVWALTGDEEKKKEFSLLPVLAPDYMGLGFSGRF